MIEGWKKQQSTLSMKWGTAGFEDEETERIEFQGETISSPVDGRPMLYFDSKHKFRNVLITYVSISLPENLPNILNFNSHRRFCSPSS